jgi:hypothetical protein
MTREVGPREAALRAMREAKLATEDVRRKDRAAVKSAGVGEELIAKIEAAKLKRGKPRKARKAKK